MENGNDKQLQESINNNDDQKWPCPKCTYFNEANVINCEICGNKKQSIPNDDKWPCTICTFLNESNVAHCSICNQPKQQKKVSPDSMYTYIYSYLMTLGIDIGDTYNLNVIFDEININNNQHCLERTKCVLKIFDLWVGLKKTEKKGAHINIYDLINYSLCPHYGFIEFLCDFKYVIDNKQLLGFDEDEKKENEKENDEDLCNVNGCYVMDRYEREKEYYSRDSNKNKQLFFASNTAMNDSDAMNKYIACQQCLDTAHCFIFHSLRINMNELMDINEENDDINNMDELCRDRMVEKLTHLIKQRRANSIRYRESKRNKSGFSKFITTNSYKKQHEINKSDNSVMCFIDVLFDNLFQHSLNTHSYNLFCAMIRNEEYDSDAIEEDIDLSHNKNNKKASNICKYIYLNIHNNNDQKLIDKICKNNMLLYVNKNNQYQAGYRFFYWPFYKNNNDEINVVYGVVIEQNEGYKLSDWYVCSAYNSFKEEILQNKTAAFCVDEWNETQFKAKNKYKAWKKRPQWKLICDWSRVDENGNDVFYAGDGWSKLYGIRSGAAITISHLMSLLFYCNFSKQSYEFSASFRKKYWNETDENLKQRHSQFAQWAKLLRETVECFGVNMNRSPVKIYYHGIGKEMLFQSTYFKIYGPLSATSEFETAHQTFAREDGMVIDIRNDGLGMMLFNCVFFSDYTDEYERFFIGGLQEFEFLSIHHINLKMDYKLFIRAIHILAMMLTGFPYKISAVKSMDVSCLSLLMNTFMDESLLLSETAHIPIYIHSFFGNFVNNINHIEINMFVVNYHKEYAKVSCYGYKLLKELFFIFDENKSGESIHFVKLFQIFTQKLERIVIFNEPRNGFVSSIHLNDIFLASILNGISMINSSVALKQIFREFIIIEPYDSITIFIHNKQKLFNANGWELKKISQIKYIHKKRSSHSDNTLCIKPI